MLKIIPSNPNYLLTGDELLNLIALRTRFRTACRTILATQGTHPSVKRLCSEGHKLEYRESIVKCAGEIIQAMHTNPVACASVARIARDTIKTISERR